MFSSIMSKVGSVGWSGVKAGAGFGAGIASKTAKAAAGGIKDAAVESSGPVGKAAEVVGKVAWEVGKATGKAAGSEALRYGGLGRDLAFGLVEEKESMMKFNKKLGKFEKVGGGYGLSKTGKAVVGGAVAYQGISGGVAAYDSSQQGRMVDQQMTTATQTVDDYTTKNDFGGATGDLVFALHTNRRG